jgi:hypothetical protein
MTVVEESDLGVDVVYGIDDKGRFLTIAGPRAKLCCSIRCTKELIPSIKLRPGHDLLQSSLKAIHFRYANVSESRDCVSIQRAQSNLIEIYQSKSSNA